MKSLAGTLCKVHQTPRRSFTRMHSGKMRTETICDACHREKEKLRYHERPIRFRQWALKHKYGITLDQYNQLFAAQDGKCKICDRPQSEFKKAFAVDHCHDTGKIRSLLCANCNSGLGKYKDDSNLLGKAFLYLQEHGK